MESSEPKMDPNSDPMPEEILFEIFTRLPVKPLCRFRCVSKLWFSLISDPVFVASHLARSKSRHKLLISVLRDDRRPESQMRFFSIDYPEQDPNGQPLHATSYGSIDFPSPAVISSSPSGLICFTCSDGIKIGNPITGDFDLIQSPVCQIFSEKSFFGFDPFDKSHVILKTVKQNYVPGPYGKSRVFNLDESQCHDAPPHPWISAGSSSICLDGVIYFTAWGDLTGSGFLGACLFAFDVRLESFQMIHRPPESVLDRNFVVELLIEYKGGVALVGDGDAYNTSVDEIWLWTLEDPKKHIWSFKSFVVPWRENLMRDEIRIDGMHPDIRRGVKLFGATHRGELIFATPLSIRGSLYMFFYEIETKTLRRFEVDGFDESYGKVSFNFVIESLQSLKGLNKNKEGRELLHRLP